MMSQEVLDIISSVGYSLDVQVAPIELLKTSKKSMGNNCIYFDREKSELQIFTVLNCDMDKIECKLNEVLSNLHYCLLKVYEKKGNQKVFRITKNI
jgi:hypothetical protein